MVSVGVIKIEPFAYFGSYFAKFICPFFVKVLILLLLR